MTALGWTMAMLLPSCSTGTEEIALPPSTATVVEPPATGELRIATEATGDVPVRATVLEAPFPSGEVVVRTCDRAPREEGKVGRKGGPTSIPAAPAGSVSGGVTTGSAPMGGATTDGSQAQPSSVARGRRGEAPNDADKTAERLRELGYSADDDLRKLKKDVERSERAPTLDPPLDRSVLDWGGVVYLSNDDSMSLASAQRMLYTVSRGMTPSPGEIRPHELLNYFSFDTVAPEPGQTFGVLGSAVADGDGLTLALAVRGANPPRLPLDLTLVVDRSGSMAAEGRMTYVKRGLGLLADNLQRGDRVDLVLFDSEVCTPLEGYVVGRDDPNLLRSAIDALAPRSATDLDAGLREGYRIQSEREIAETHGRNRRMLLLTDAELNAGNVQESLVSEVGRKLDEIDVHLSGIGVGREFNDHFLDLLTEKGRGAYVYVGSEAVVDRVFGSGFDALVRTVAHDVQFELDLPDSLAMERFYGEEASTRPEDVDPIHYHAGTTQLFLQDLAIRDRIVREDPVRLTVRWRDATTMEPTSTELRTTVGALLDADPSNVHKGRALMAFADWVTADAMGADPCGEPFGAFRARAAQVDRSDAEIAYVGGLVAHRCGSVAPPAPGVDVKVKVDADVPISAVSITCPGASTLQTSLSGSDTVARFGDVAVGTCTVELAGATPLRASLDVPETGVDVRCTVRAGRLHCG